MENKYSLICVTGNTVIRNNPAMEKKYNRFSYTSLVSVHVEVLLQRFSYTILVDVYVEVIDISEKVYDINVLELLTITVALKL